MHYFSIIFSNNLNCNKKFHKITYNLHVFELYVKHDGQHVEKYLPLKAYYLIPNSHQKWRLHFVFVVKGKNLYP